MWEPAIQKRRRIVHRAKHRTQTRIALWLTLPVDELQDSPNDTVAIRIAKTVARQSIDGKIAFAVEAANRTEGKPREMDNTEQPVGQKKDLAGTVKFIRQFYGLADPLEDGPR